MIHRAGPDSLDLTPISASALTAPRMLRGWRWLMASTLLNTLIALALTLTTASHGVGFLGFGINWLYSQCIGLAIWGLIDIGRLALTPDEQRQWRRLCSPWRPASEAPAGRPRVGAQVRAGLPGAPGQAWAAPAALPLCLRRSAAHQRSPII